MSTKGYIEIRNLSKAYSRTNGQEDLWAIKDVNLEIAAGEFVSIVGTSGCGKSTLLRIIAGLEAPSSGQVIYDGEEVQGTHPNRGLVFQEHTLFPWLTIRGNIDFALKASKKYAEESDKVDSLLEAAGLSDFANSYPHQLSGGMRQRAALIRSVAVSPSTLLLDEPLGALDNFTRMTLQDEIVRLWKERESTMILVTHDVDEAIYLSNKIVVMTPRPGQITEVIDVPLSYPRNRGTSDFTALRTRLLKLLDFASDTVQDYYL